MALLHLRVDLLDRLEADTHDDQQGGAAERKVLIRVDEHQSDKREKGDERPVERAREVDATEQGGQLSGCRSTKKDTRNEASVLLHIVCDLFGVECDRQVEVS